MILAVRWFAVGYAVAASCAAAAGEQTQQPPTGTTAHVETAIDFAFPPLRFYDFKIDRQEITRENAGELYRNVRLSDFRGKRPVVVLFGKEGTFDDIAAFEQLHERYRRWLQFLFVYVADSLETGEQSTALEQMRRANTFVRANDLHIPCLVETAETRTDIYRINNNRVFVVDHGGKVAYAAPADAALDEIDRNLRIAATDETGL